MESIAMIRLFFCVQGLLMVAGSYLVLALIEMGEGLEEARAKPFIKAACYLLIAAVSIQKVGKSIRVMRRRDSMQLHQS